MVYIPNRSFHIILQHRTMWKTTSTSQCLAHDNMLRMEERTEDHGMIIGSLDKAGLPYHGSNRGSAQDNRLPYGTSGNYTMRKEVGERFLHLCIVHEEYLAESHRHLLRRRDNRPSRALMVLELKDTSSALCLTLNYFYSPT